MTGTPLYNLSWGEYGTSLVAAVQLLRCHGELVDVTLAAGGKTFLAHKVVLCAASPFLLDLLKSTTCKHPVVMLAGVQASDLEALLEFVYRGEVGIDPNQLPSLLQAAHCLNIQGLTTNSTPMNNEITQQPSPISTNLEEDKASDLNQLSISSESRSQDDEVPSKRRKRAKRLSKSEISSPLAKWSKVYVQVDSSENLIAAAASGSQEVNTHTWNQHMNIVNLSSPTTVDALPLQTPILVQNLPSIPNPTSNTGSTTGPKIRGASDQPGTCPLCGAMLRQARNLRRHLLTSCKYRMITGGHSSSSVTSATQIDSHKSHETQFHELQTISVQNLGQVNRASAEQLDNKDGLTSISCRELLPGGGSGGSGGDIINEYK